MKKLQTHFRKHKQSWLLAVSPGLALFFVLYVYEAYQIQQGDSLSGHSHFVRSFIFGLATSLSFALHEFGLKGFFFKRYNYPHKIVAWVAWEILVGANLTFLLFNYFWNWTEWRIYGYFLILFEYTVAVIFPILLIYQLSKPAETNPKARPESNLVFRSKNGKNIVRVSTEVFLYVKSEENYLEIFYLSDNELKSELIRNTLKNMETLYPENPCFVRCHRGYIVNPQKIIQTSEKNRKFYIDLGHSILIPVSQKYRARFAQ